MHMHKEAGALTEVKGMLMGGRGTYACRWWAVHAGGVDGWNACVRARRSVSVAQSCHGHGLALGREQGFGDPWFILCPHSTPYT